MKATYKETDKMADVICDEYRILQMMSRFGIPLGVGEKTVKEVCESANVHPTTFLAVANYLKQGALTMPFYVDKVSVESLIKYLSQAHDFFLNFQLPGIRRRLLDAIDCSQQNDIAFLILRFYDEYMQEVRRHMQMENRRVFTYVEQLLKGVVAQEFDITSLQRSHDASDKKLQELKNVIIKYYNAEQAEPLSQVLFDIFTCEADMRAHCEVEDLLFVPAVALLEKKVAQGHVRHTNDYNDTTETLSEREREIVTYVVRGFTNKQIAEKLFISVNTVLTHRKNISRKLDIHTPTALTIYAIVNKLVNLDEVKV